MVALARGRTVEAAVELRAVLALQEQALGADHDETAQTRRNLNAVAETDTDPTMRQPWTS